MKRRPQPPRPRALHQRGAALLTAMIIVTLVVTLSAAMVWQQFRAVQVEQAERSRTQSAWILNGALDWAVLILREDGRTGGPDHLGEPWAVPLAEARLSTFLAADRDHTDDGPEAFLSGSIVDLQARYNLRNLYNDSTVITEEVEALQRLCTAIGVGPEVATTLATALTAAQVRGTDENRPDSPLMPRSVTQLGWLGIGADTVRRLAPHVTLLPARTPVNVNTASREVLSAVIKGLDLASAERLVQVRQRSHFRTLQEVEAQVPTVAPLNPQALAVSSNYFEVRGKLRLADRVLEQRSVVQRQGRNASVLQREVVAAHES